jgi:hypothetical protein
MPKEANQENLPPKLGPRAPRKQHLRSNCATLWTAGTQEVKGGFNLKMCLEPGAKLVSQVLATKNSFAH